MMWRGAVFSSILHGSLLVGVIGGLSILPGIFKRSIETDSTGLQIPVEVVSESALGQMSEVAGLRNTAPDAETVAPLPRRVIGALKPVPSDRTPSPDAPPPTPPLSVPSPASPPAAARGTQSSDAPRASEQGRPATTTVVGSPAKPDVSAAPPQSAQSPPVPRSDVQRGAGPAPIPEPKPGIAESPPQEAARKASSGSVEVEFLTAVSGRKRELVADLLEADPRLRRAVMQGSESADMPEQARRRTVERLSRSAEAGFAHAQYNLASRYLRGDGLPKDMKTAQKWLTRSAEQGYAPAQSLLALMRFTGMGVDQDQAEAAFWWLLAAETDNPGAKLASTRLRPLLKPQEYIRSQRLRARWGSLISDLADLATGETSRRDIDRALQAAAEKGDLDTVLSLLARGADADKSGENGRSAVINAAWRGRQRIIKLLLERGVETELPDEDGRTALIWAAINGHKGVVADLVAGGANPNRKDKSGGTALIRAAWNAHLSVATHLIDAGADVNARDDNGLTALAHARREGNTEIIRLLEAAGAR